MKSEFRQKIKFSNPIHFLAVGFGSGLSPIMPGTMGSLAAIPVWLLFCYFSPLFYWLVIVLTFVFGCYICQKTSIDTDTKDSGHIVWDEFIGMWITLYFMPEISLVWIIIAFIAFRIFDMAKPWPIRWFDRNVSGGFGIMLDDVVAALFSSAAVWLLALIIYR